MSHDAVDVEFTQRRGYFSGGILSPGKVMCMALLSTSVQEQAGHIIVVVQYCVSITLLRSWPALFRSIVYGLRSPRSAEDGKVYPNDGDPATHDVLHPIIVVSAPPPTTRTEIREVLWITPFDWYMDKRWR